MASYGSASPSLEIPLKGAPNVPTMSASKNDFKLTDSDFTYLVDTIYDHAGIVLNQGKRDLVQCRLGRRLRELRLDSFNEYCKLLNSAKARDELTVMTNALTTNLTAFYREAHHFEHLKEVALPEIQDYARKNDQRLRIWSSACSTGEEPYSIAMTLLESSINRSKWDARVLATDVNTEVLSSARNGIYSEEALAKLPADLRRLYIDRSQHHDSYSIKESVRDLISFRQLNLLGTWPMHGPFDVIFCRNVLIYFDHQTKCKLIDRFINLLRPGGWLYLGHSETLSGNHEALTLTGRTTYRRKV